MIRWTLVSDSGSGREGARKGDRNAADAIVGPLRRQPMIVLISGSSSAPGNYCLSSNYHETGSLVRWAEMDREGRVQKK